MLIPAGKVHNHITYVHQCIPLFPKVAICNHTNGVSELVLNIRRDRDHETDEFLFDSADFILG